MYKNQLTSILQLDAAAKKVFRGVYAMDRLPIRAQTSAAYVINMDDHDEPGSHWIAVFCDKYGRVEYMDSYGLVPLDERCRNFLGSNFTYNTLALQRLLSSACGFYCVYYLLHRARGISAESILKPLSRTDSDYIVKKFLYSRYKPIFN